MSTTDTPRAFEREADATRVRLSNSLDQLVNSLTPGRVLDEVLTYAKGGGGTFLKGLGNAASANPIPSALIGVGAALFLTGKGRVPTATERGSDVLRHAAARERAAGQGGGSAFSSVGDGVKSVLSSATGAVGSVLRSASGAIGSSVGAVGGAASRAGDAVTGAVRSGTAGVAEAADYVGTTVSDAARMAADSAGSAIDSITDAGSSLAGSAMDEAEYLRDESTRMFHDARDAALRLAREQPLVAAAAGLAIGVAIAAMLPRSRLEDKLMGETSDAVKDTVASVATEQYVKVKEAAGKVVGEARSAATSAGISPGAAADAVKDLGDKLKTVVSAVGDRAGGEMDRDTSRENRGGNSM